VRCGGNWKRDYGDSYTGTKGETLDTAKESPTSYRTSSRPYQRHETPADRDLGIASTIRGRARSAYLTDHAQCQLVSDGDLYHGQLGVGA
jgi:hypothetical protein